MHVSGYAPSPTVTDAGLTSDVCDVLVAGPGYELTFAVALLPHHDPAEAYSWR